MSQVVFKQATQTFQHNVESVFQLAEFDHVVLDYSISVLKTIQKRATQDGIDNYRLTVDKGLEQVQNIRAHDSMRTDYEHIFNQCVVLLVSYFGSAISEIFEACIAELLKTDSEQPLLREEVKLTVRELFEMDSDPRGRVGELLIRKDKISFQDMKSIARAFADHCGHRPEKNHDVNDIIVGQACRHAIVHAGAIVSAKCAEQVKKAVPRSLKEDLPKDSRIQFTVDELHLLSESMKRYVANLTSGLESVLANKTTVASAAKGE